MRRLFPVLLLCAAMQGQAAEPAHDMGKMWQGALQRTPLAVGVAFDARGRLWRAMVKDDHVWVSHSEDQGAHYSAPVQVNPEAEHVAADGENRPKIVVARNGNVYVSYTQSLETPFAGNVRFSRSSDDGASFSAPITVNDHQEPVTHRFETLGVDGKGRVVLAWLDKRDAQAAKDHGEKFAGISVYSAVSADAGKSFKTNFLAAAHSCECCRITMANDRDGVPVIAWRHVFEPNIRDHALMRLDGKSALKRATFGDWKVDACPHHGPALSIAKDGVYHLSWFNNSESQRGLFYAYSSDQGAHFSSPMLFGAAQASHPSVLSLGKRVYLAWKAFDGEQTQIMAMRSDDGGKVWSSPESVAETADQSDHPQLIANGKQVYLSWNTLKVGHRVILLAEQGRR